MLIIKFSLLFRVQVEDTDFTEHVYNFYTLKSTVRICWQKLVVDTLKLQSFQKAFSKTKRQDLQYHT